MKKRGKDIRSYIEDSCPTCGEPCIKACRCPLNDRACKNNHWWRRDHKTDEVILLDGPHGNPIGSSIDDVADLTFDMSGKTDDELWNIVADACRITTPAWRAYERLRSRYGTMVRQINSAKE